MLISVKIVGALFLALCATHWLDYNFLFPTKFWILCLIFACIASILLGFFGVFG